MKVFPPVNDERPLVDLVGDSILYLGAKHHLRAVHVVEHHIVKSWFKGLLVNEVEVNLLVCCDLDSHIPFDVVYGTSLSDRVILLPLPLISDVVQFKLIEQDFT
jgi:hypothetical protein